MAKIIMGIGIPGSGKTTVLKPFANKNNYTYISPDEIRAELSGDAFDQSKNKEVWEEAHRRVVEALERGETIVFDATFVKDFERKNFIKFARENGAEKVQGVFAEVPLEIASERNKARDRVIPEYAMERMHSTLQTAPPAIEDGFDNLFYINELAKIERIERGGERDNITRDFPSKLH